MSRRANAVLAAGVSVFALSAPAASFASSGGGGLSPTSRPSTTAHAPAATSAPAAASAPATQPGNVTVTASGNGMTLATRTSGFLRNQLRFTGSAPAADAGATVEIERLGHQTGWTWAPTAHARVRSDGSFTVVWRANHIGRFSIRAVISSGQAARAATASPALTLTVYRAAVATQYGAGFWGSTTACGEVLHRSTLGVANRTLRCGTLVAIYYEGRTLVVPVIDRGPYANGADWDLTVITSRLLGMPGNETIGAVSLPLRP